MGLNFTLDDAAPSDESLIQGIASKDKDALESLYQRYRQPLGVFIGRKLCAQKLVDEVFNDVMFTVWQKADGFRGDSKASTWIFGIAYHNLLSATRKEGKHNRNRSIEDPQDLENQLVASTQVENPINEQLEQGIQALSDNHRTVIELAYFHDHSLNDIAMIVSAPINTIKTRLFHARQHLKKYLEPDQ